MHVQVSSFHLTSADHRFAVNCWRSAPALASASMPSSFPGRRDEATAGWLGTRPVLKSPKKARRAPWLRPLWFEGQAGRVVADHAVRSSSSYSEAVPTTW